MWGTVYPQWLCGSVGLGATSSSALRTMLCCIGRFPETALPLLPHSPETGNLGGKAKWGSEDQSTAPVEPCEQEEFKHRQQREPQVAGFDPWEAGVLSVTTAKVGTRGGG